jgi:hypothetical protein
MSPAVVGTGVALALVAFLLRVAIHWSRTPSGVDTWYFLAYADAVRRRPGIDVRLPQYLLQEERQSYPPLFPSLLALLPPAWLRKWFWMVSPAIDCLHLLLLFWLSYKITRDLTVSAVTACVYAFTPQLVSETRSLNGRSFGTLLHSMAVVLNIRYVVSDGGWPWLAMAILAGAALMLSSATSSAAYFVVCVALAVGFDDVRYVAIAAVSGAAALLLSGGHLVRIVRNYVEALGHWRRQRRWFGAHPIRDSPIYGTSSADARPLVRSKALLPQLARLIGENPFILALPLAPRGLPPWGTRFYLWAVVLTGLAVVATVLPPLRAFGPGRTYLKTAVFPTAYTLAVAIGTPGGLARPVGIATIAGLIASVTAIAYFYAYIARQSTERTSSVPEGLAEATAALATRPRGGVLCLPYMYADYVCYNSRQPVLWGGHCGDLRRFEELAPVITRPLPSLLSEHAIRYLLVDRLYVSPVDLQLDGRVAARGRWASFELYEVIPGESRPTPGSAEARKAG